MYLLEHRDCFTALALCLVVAPKVSILHDTNLTVCSAQHTMLSRGQFMIRRQRIDPQSGLTVNRPHHRSCDSILDFVLAICTIIRICSSIYPYPFPSPKALCSES